MPCACQAGGGALPMSLALAFTVHVEPVAALLLCVGSICSQCGLTILLHFSMLFVGMAAVDNLVVGSLASKHFGRLSCRNNRSAWGLPAADLNNNRAAPAQFRA